MFQISGGFSVNNNVQIALTNGANMENIFWLVKGDVNIAAGSQVLGTILTTGRVFISNGASANRIFAVGSSSSVTLSNNALLFNFVPTTAPTARPTSSPTFAPTAAPTFDFND
jgi:hypothetical protein